MVYARLTVAVGSRVSILKTELLSILSCVDPKELSTQLQDCRPIESV